MLVIAAHKDGNTDSRCIETDDLFYGSGDGLICQILTDYAGAPGYPEDNRLSVCGSTAERKTPLVTKRASQ